VYVVLLLAQPAFGRCLFCEGTRTVPRTEPTGECNMELTLSVDAPTADYCQAAKDRWKSWPTGTQWMKKLADKAKAGLTVHYSQTQFTLHRAANRTSGTQCSCLANLGGVTKIAQEVKRDNTDGQGGCPRIGRNERFRIIGDCRGDTFFVDPCSPFYRNLCNAYVAPASDTSKQAPYGVNEMSTMCRMVTDRTPSPLFTRKSGITVDADFEILFDRGAGAVADDKIDGASDKQDFYDKVEEGVNRAIRLLRDLNFVIPRGLVFLVSLFEAPVRVSTQAYKFDRQGRRTNIISLTHGALWNTLDSMSMKFGCPDGVNPIHKYNDVAGCVGSGCARTNFLTKIMVTTIHEIGHLYHSSRIDFSNQQQVTCEGATRNFLSCPSCFGNYRVSGYAASRQEFVAEVFAAKVISAHSPHIIPPTSDILGPDVEEEYQNSLGPAVPFTTQIVSAAPARNDNSDTWLRHAAFCPNSA